MPRMYKSKAYRTDVAILHSSVNLGIAIIEMPLIDEISTKISRILNFSSPLSQIHYINCFTTSNDYCVTPVMKKKC